jgi:DNA-directed RNA polymerase subunit M/transcription elongation factor TFIIS
MTDSTHIHNKLDIIQKIPNGRLLLKLQNTSIPLLSFSTLNTNIPITDPKHIPFEIERCTHEWSTIDFQQIRKGDEAPTTVLQCKKCQRKNYM